MTVLATPQVQGESLPAVKWNAIGDVFVGRIVDAKMDIPDKDMDSGEVKLNAKGNAKTQHLLVTHAMNGTTARVGDKTTNHDAEVGETIALWISGADKFLSENPECFSNIFDAHGSLQIGDVIKVVYEADKPTRYPKPMKVKRFALRHAKADGTEVDAVAAASAAYAKRQAAQAPVVGTPEPQSAPQVPASQATSVDDF